MTDQNWPEAVRSECVRVSRRTGEREEWRGWRNAVSKSTHKTALISEPWRGPGTYHSCQQSHSLAKTHRSAVLNQVLSTLPSKHESPNRNYSINKKVPTLRCCHKAPLAWRDELPVNLQWWTRLPSSHRFVFLLTIAVWWRLTRAKRNTRLSSSDINKSLACLKICECDVTVHVIFETEELGLEESISNRL